MNNTSSANVSIDVKHGLSLSTLSRPEGIAWCTVFALLSLFITVGNLLTIVLFAANKRVRKKSLYLVINMALADLLLGAFALPLYIYISINNGYQFSLKTVNSTLARVYGLSYGTPRKRHFTTEEKGREKRSFDEDLNVFFYS